MIAALAISLVSIAAICSAVQDTVRDHWETSIFRKWKHPDWWHSHWSYVKRRREEGAITQLADAWHAAKTIKIGAWCALPAVMLSVDYEPEWWGYVAVFMVLAAVWNLVFNLFYDRVLLT